MQIGNLVKQILFERSSLRGKYKVYRYGIVTSLTAPEPVRRVCSKEDNPIEVYFTPTAAHPVGIAPYKEYVASSLLEVVSE